MKIGIAIADYYPEISENLVGSVKKNLKKNGFKNYKIFYVGGIFEIPYIVTKKINNFDAFIALGCVIKGKTPHFDFLSSSVFSSLLHISIMKKKPIINGILTCLNINQALVRSKIAKKDKGKECVKALIKLLNKTK